ncbi:MAG: amidohydrolase [Gammaproteobacteria bacterium]|jgi:aminobenzoyl-glutamate utilization protein B
MRYSAFVLAVLSVCLISAGRAQTGLEQQEPVPELTNLQREAIAGVDARRKLVQEIVDSLFSFSELGFQEFETQRYLTETLEANGFEVEHGVAGIPSAWWATWGSGAPVIALGSDVDGIPRASQMPGVVRRQPLVDGAPGHGEGHNSGQAVNIAAALAVKDIMQRERLGGTIVLWPGIAEELLAAKAWFARDGLFDGVDAVIFTHVDDSMVVNWGQSPGTGLISVEYSFTGVPAHGAADPWRGRSALDGVELMNVAWNFRREHLRPLQRSHYVIVDGGDQPNVVPSTATVWYFVREITAAAIRENFERLQRTAEGAALMTDTTVERRIVGAAYPRHYNKPIAEAMYANMRAIGMPQWSDDDQAFARAFQTFMEAEEITGLKTEIDALGTPPETPISGGSDDIGDVSWNVPTVTLRFPSNIDGRIGHHWSSAIAMATPIAHKGAVAGARVVAATMIDLLEDASLRDAAWTYFRDEQNAADAYEPFISAEDPPAIEKNADTMAEYKTRLETFYYDSRRYDSYLEQLGVDYPELE